MRFFMRILSLVIVSASVNSAQGSTCGVSYNYRMIDAALLRDKSSRIQSVTTSDGRTHICSSQGNSYREVPLVQLYGPTYLRTWSKSKVYDCGSGLVLHASKKGMLALSKWTTHRNGNRTGVQICSTADFREESNYSSPSAATSAKVRAVR